MGKERNLSPAARLGRGMTLAELTVVIMISLIVLSVTMAAAAAWKKGVDRARCIMNIRQMQVSVRAYSNLRELDPGDDVSEEFPEGHLLEELVGPGGFVPRLPRCPGGGMYLYGGDVIPAVGVLYMRCSLAERDGHRPEEAWDW